MHTPLVADVDPHDMVVFVNKVDLVDDPDLIDLVELETRDLLTRYGFDGDRVEVLGWAVSWRRSSPASRRSTGPRTWRW